MRAIRMTTILAAVALLAAGGKARAALQGGAPDDKMATLSVPKMSCPPLIDGKIDPQEWRESTAVSGVGNCRDDVLLPDPTTFYLGWDGSHLYFACRTYLQPGYKPRVKGRSQGLAYIWDDALELNWKPMGANVPADGKRNSYKWFLNSLGFVGDCSRLALGQQFKNWSPKFVIETRLTEPGTAPGGGRWWEMELSSTPEDFELEGPHRAGDQWKIMLGINHFPAWMQARIPCNGPYLDPFGFNVITLVEKSPAVQLLMETIPNLASDGTAALTVRAFNPTMAPVNLSLEIDVAGTIKKTRTLAVAAGQSTEFALCEKLPAGVTEGELSVKVKEGDGELCRYWTRFRVGEGVGRLQAAAKRDPDTFRFEANFNPARSWLLVKGDTYYLEDPAQARALDYRVVPEGGGAALAEGSITEVAEYYLQDVLKLPPLAPGEYTVEATMELAGGRRLGPMRSRFEKKDEAREFARWWGKKHGDIERVLPPYTGVKREGDTISVILRDYELSALGLPIAVTSTGERVTAAPARIVVVIDGEETVVTMGRPDFTKVTDWKVEFEGVAAGAGLTFAARGWVEQDGLVYLDLTYQPAGGRTVKVDALRLEYPLAGTDADALVCIGPGANFSSRTTMLLPRGRTGRLWSTLDTGITGSGMTLGSFYPTVWIGSERRGFLWWADNDQGWVQDDAVPAHEAVGRDGAVVLVNHIVAQPTELSGPRTVSLSYVATPFKPLPRGWRMTVATDDGTFFQPFRGVRTNPRTGQKYWNPARGHINWIHPESDDPEEWPALWAEQKKSADAHARSHQWRDPYAARSGINFTHMSFQIMGYGRKSIEASPYAYFGSEWEGGMDTWNETYTDYAMSLFAPAFAQGGVRHTYWDLSFPINDFDLLSGLAYRLPDGRMQRGYNGWNVRRFMMRLHALQYDAGLVPGANGFHSSNAYLTVAMPWTDAVLDGERNWDLDTSPLDWVDNMPIERMRSMSSPHSWGVGICWMGNMDSKSEEKRNEAKREQACWVWMHDSWRNPYIEVLDRMPQPVLDWGVNDESTIYHPYWRNPFVSCADEDVLVSLWRTGERVMLGVFNYGRNRTRDAELKVDLARLGMDPNEVHGRTLWALDGVQATLDAGSGVVRVKALAGHRLILFGIAATDAAEVDRAVRALPSWVKGGLPSPVMDFGLVSRETKHYTPGQAPGVKCGDEAIQIGMWRLPDRVLLFIYNSADQARDAILEVDLGALDLEQRLIWQEFVGVRQLYAESGARAPDLNYYDGRLTVRGLPARSGRLVAIRRY